MAQVEANAQQLQTREHREGQRSPVVLAELKKRADDWQLHLADRITGFAGSMTFVWVHVAILRSGSRPGSSARTATRSSS